MQEFWGFTLSDKTPWLTRCQISLFLRARLRYCAPQKRWTMFLLSLLLTLSAHADAKIVCGGNYSGEDFVFTMNPLNGAYTARTKDERFLVFVDLSNPEKPHVLYGEDIADVDWEKLKAIRDAQTDQQLKDLISRFGSTNLTEMWVGWTADGYFLVESQQRDRKFSLSCQKVSS